MLSEHTFFVIERITDILKLVEDKEVEFSNDVKGRIVELQKELSRNYNYLIDVEPKSYYNEYDQQFYLNLSYIVESSDDILDRVMNNDDVGNGWLSACTCQITRLFCLPATPHDIDTLLEDIRKSYHPSSIQYKLKIVVKHNINSGGPQNIANLNFKNHSKPSKDKKDSRPKSFGHYRNPHLVGFNHEIQTLLNQLLQTYDVTRFVGIVGMGGSGKTTLAKHIYHHLDIKTHFSLKVWVCVSQSCDKAIILNSIRRQATGNTTIGEMGYDQVVENLFLLLSSGTYLVILDDIWSIDIWTHICQVFPREGRNAIVVTTRRKDVPKTIDATILIVEPKQLGDEESYELFKKIAPLLDKNTPHDLLSLGMKMVKKCKGLPLAIITLAGVLQMNNSRSTWERISERLTHHILASEEGVVKAILELSYNELPHHLKPCALYLRIFPEDFEIEAQNLIQMWIAERFIDEEIVAEEYLDELAQRSIVEVVETDYMGQVLLFRIHDLIRQMFVDMSQDSLRLAPSRSIFGDEQKSSTSQNSGTISGENLERYGHVL